MFFYSAFCIILYIIVLGVGNTKETYKRDLQKRPTKVIYILFLGTCMFFYSAFCIILHIIVLGVGNTKETYKRDLQKRQRDLQKRPTKVIYILFLETCMFFYSAFCIILYIIVLGVRNTKETYKRNLKKRPTTVIYICFWRPTYSSIVLFVISYILLFLAYVIQKRPTKRICKRDQPKRPAFSSTLPFVLSYILLFLA